MPVQYVSWLPAAYHKDTVVSARDAVIERVVRGCAAHPGRPKAPH